MTTQTIPDGFLEDAQGRYVPKDKVKPEDLQKDELVRKLISDAKQLQEQLVNFKASALGDTSAHVELVAEQYGASLGGKKGNLTLVSYDGRFKVQVAVSDRLTFDEKITAAKALIDECLNDWTKDGRDEVKIIVKDAFAVDKEGQLNTARILGLRKLNIKDDRWQRAMTAISDSLSVLNTSTYIRFYERPDSEGKWKAIALDLAVV